ncbi:MAG TPA: T9SS type A sorting domain-containing protein [Candidatus Kapabacteria bacterium]|jgi:hypothetical protein|nr:T9SS type A sorting domain-containing protein [Candidatus Kapabacteria bacterium]
MLKRSIFVVVIFMLFQASYSEAQITWNKIILPDTITGFSIGSDGSIYVRTGVYRPSHDLYFSSDRGSQWTKVYPEKLRFLACDSNGAVIVCNDSSIVYSVDQGINWIKLSNIPYGYISGKVGLECTRDAIYFIPGYNNALYRNVNYDSTWSSSAMPGDEIDDLTGPYCGSPDRVVVGLNFESGWKLLDSLFIESDTMCNMQGPTIDNSPPRLITFGKDGYLYMTYASYIGFRRLPPELLQWDCYDPYDRSWNDRTHHFPYSSVSSTMLISIDTGGTWTSDDHGTTWGRIGSAPPLSWVQQMNFDSKGHGYAYTDSGLFETNFFAGIKQPISNMPELRVYPNPCSSTLGIALQTIDNLEIIDALGRTQMQFSHLHDNPEIDIKMLPSGIYYVRCRTNNVQKIGTFVKQ